MQVDATLEGSLLSDKIASSLQCLRTNFRTTPAGGGWYHYLDDPDPGVTASAVGLYTFSLANETFERTDEVIRFLLSQQIVSDDGQNGGWAVRTTHGFPIIEATAWVVRTLSLPGIQLTVVGDALRRGAAWIERNQNTDFGWGSYQGQQSRVFHTALAMLALQECGGDKNVIDNAQKWLIDTQNATQPAWGPTAGAEPTLLHTSFALMALAKQRGALGANSVRETCDWIFDRLQPGAHVERATTVEEYDVPLRGSGRPPAFQNSLPHFAGPIGLAALLGAGADPFRVKIFSMARSVAESQTENGAWELPRSPTRPSIWAIWPFVAALSTTRRLVLPTPGSTAQLVFPGCSIVQTENTARNLTRRVLVRNALFDWVRRRWSAILLYCIVAALIGITIVLLALKQIGITDALLALLVPALLLVFQLTWDRRRKTRP